MQYLVKYHINKSSASFWSQEVVTADSPEAAFASLLTSLDIEAITRPDDRRVRMRAYEIAEEPVAEGRVSKVVSAKIDPA